jgi:hypothetical protein
MELAELFVAIKADVKPFNTAIDGVKSKLTSLKPTFDAIQSAAQKVFFAIAGAFTASAYAAGDAERSDQALASALRQTTDEALETTDGINRLTKSFDGLAASMAAAGRSGAAQAAFAQIKGELDAYAVALQRVTVYGDDFIKEQMAAAINLGVTADQLKAVTQLGIGLGQMFFGGDAAAGIDAMAKAQQGNFRALQKLIPELKNAHTNTEKLAIVQKVAERGFEQAKARADTFSGSVLQLWENVGDVAEVFGGVLTPSLKLVNQYLSAAAVALQKLSPEQQQSIVKWAAITAAIAGTIIVAPRVVAAFGFIGTTIRAVSGVATSVGVAAFNALRAAIATTWTVAAANPFTVALAAIAALATGIAYLGGTGDTAFERISDGFANFNRSAASAWNQTVAFIGGIWDRFATGIVISLGKSFDSLKEAFNTVVTYWGGVLTRFDNFLRDTFGGVYTTVGTVLGAVAGAFGTAFKFIAGIVGDVVGYVGSLFTEGFGIIGGVVGDFASVFASIADTMFGSWQGFVQGLVTLWNQAGFILLKGWYGVKAMFLNVWEDIKFAGSAVFYYWGGVIGEFAQKTYGAMRTLAENIRNMWNTMIDAIASKMATFLAKRQAAADIEANFKEGDVVDDKLVKRLQIQGGLSAQEAEGYRGKTLTADDINTLIQRETARRLEYQNRMEAEEKRRKDREHTENLNRIQKETDAAVDAMRQWSDKGLNDANISRDSGRAANNAERDKQLRDIEQARLADLQRDLEKMKSMPKLSDKAAQALEMIRKGLDFTKVRDFIKGIIDGFDQEKLDAEKNLKLGNGLRLGDAATMGEGGKSIEEAFKANLRKQIMPGALALSAENEKRRQEAEKKREEARQKEQQRATEKNTQTTDKNTKAMEKLSDAITKYGAGAGGATFA